MKPLFGVAVFGLLAVPPMSARDGGGPDERPSAAEDLKRFELESHTNDNKHDEPAPDPVEDPSIFTPERARGWRTWQSRCLLSVWLRNPENSP
jgi:hypothetical protein